MISPSNQPKSMIQCALTGLVMTAGIMGAGAVASTANAEIPYFEDAVASGSLPAMNDRLPEHPHVIDFAAEDKEIGKYGGEFVTIMG
ncbi:MAG TPA: peptide ABC transporter substrate-binding protein, partial [Thalassospira sp.]|nr:peptide ABC transporter substrate-binding protein [Thalassospira sp.]